MNKTTQYTLLLIIISLLLISCGKSDQDITHKYPHNIDLTPHSRWDEISPTNCTINNHEIKISMHTTFDQTICDTINKITLALDKNFSFTPTPKKLDAIRSGLLKKSLIKNLLKIPEKKKGLNMLLNQKIMIMLINLL